MARGKPSFESGGARRRAAVWLMSWSPSTVTPPLLPHLAPLIVAVFRQAVPRVSALVGKSRRRPGVENGNSFACWVCSQGRAWLCRVGHSGTSWSACPLPHARPGIMAVAGCRPSSRPPRRVPGIGEKQTEGGKGREFARVARRQLTAAGSGREGRAAELDRASTPQSGHAGGHSRSEANLTACCV